MKIEIKPVILSTILLSSFSVNAVDVLVESFETNGNGTRYQASVEFSDSDDDYFQRTDGSDIETVTSTYFGFDGTFFWAAEDVDDDGGNGLTPQTVEFTDLDITNLDNLVFTGLFAAGNENLPGASNYDAADFVRVEYRIDGSGNDPYQPGVCFGFERDSDDFNEPFGLDADCDGESDGPAGRLGVEMAQHGFNINAVGSTLDLRISVSVDAASEEFAFDNFIITGDIFSGDNPPVVTSTVPDDQSVGFDASGNVVINFSEAVNATANAVTFNCAQTGVVNFSGLPLNNATTMTLDPDNDLIDGLECTVTLLAAEIVDTDGVPDQLNNGTDYVISFTVGFPVVEIFEIQGNGMSSAFVDSRVTTKDNIVTALDNEGFFMQTPDARDDNDVETSNGIFVFTDSPVPVSVGDQVDVTGDVIEFFGLTEFTNPGTLIINVDSSGNTLPTAIVLDSTFPSSDPTVFPCGTENLEYECLEGMLFDMPEGVVSQPYVSFFGANRDDVLVKAGSQRAFREPGIQFPGETGLPVFDGNPELLEMDIDALTLPLTTLSAGSVVSIKGVFGFDFGEYEIWPSEIQVITENILPSVVRDAGVDEFTVGSLNLFRLFNAVDDIGPEDDDQIADPAEYAQRLTKISNYIRNDLKTPAILTLQEVENIDVANDLVNQIITDGGPVYTAALVEGNDQGGIDVAYLYQANLMTNVAINQLGAAELLTVDGSLLHDRPPLHLRADVLAQGVSQTINLLAVHMRSRSNIDDTTDGARVRQKRLEQAQSIAVMVESIQSNFIGEPVVILGDYNAFQFTDGYVDVMGQIAGTAVDIDNMLWQSPLLANNPLTQSAQTLTAVEQYSYIFRGNAQVLDNALINDSALPLFNEMQYARGNADAPLIFETDGATSLRSSDHDGFVLFFLVDLDLIFKNNFE